MALSKETITIYLGSVHDEQTKTVWSALAVPESRMRSLFSRVDSVMKTSWKGSRLKDLSIEQMEDSRLEKIGASVLGSLFSSNMADGLLLEFHEGNSAKNTWILTEFFRTLSSMTRGQNTVLMYDPKQVRAASVNSALKKSGSVMKTEKTSETDSLGLRISAFLAQTLINSGPHRFASLHSVLDLEIRSGKHFRKIDGDLLWLKSSLPADAYDVLVRSLKTVPGLAGSALIETMIRKKADPDQFVLLCQYLENGGSFEALEQAPGTQISAKIEYLQSEEERQKLRKKVYFPKLHETLDVPLAEQQIAAVAADLNLSAEQLREELKSRLVLLAGPADSTEGIVPDRISESLSNPANRRKHAFIGCYRNPKTGREECGALIPYHSFLIDALKSRASGAMDESSFSQIMNSAKTGSQFRNWISAHFLVISPAADAKEYFDQLKSLIVQIAEISEKTMIHMPLLTGQDLKAVLIEENWYLPYTLEKEREQPLLRLARLQAGLIQNEKAETEEIETGTEGKQTKNPETGRFIEDHRAGNSCDLQRKAAGLPKFILESSRHQALTDAQKKILSSPWLNTALTKRMADAFYRGLSAVQVSFVLWNEKGGAREWAVRSLLLEYLYPARTRSFLMEQQKVRTLDEYDFLSHPGFSLEKMQAVARAFDQGYPLDQLRKKINQNSTLRAIEQASAQIPEPATQNRADAEDMQADRVSEVWMKDRILLGHEAERMLVWFCAEDLAAKTDPQTEEEKRRLLEQVLIAGNELISMLAGI